jgi:hypothetical protein
MLIAHLIAFSPLAHPKTEIFQARTKGKGSVIRTDVHQSTATSDLQKEGELQTIRNSNGNIRTPNESHLNTETINDSNSHRHALYIEGSKFVCFFLGCLSCILSSPTGRNPYIIIEFFI